MQRLIKLTSFARQAKQRKINAHEYAESKFYSRREFLVNSSMAAVATTALAGCGKEISKPVNGAATPSIAIIGAGIAGLHAGFILKQAGVPSKIYDASARCGGRILTAHNILNDGLSTELGGEFIDSNHTDMKSLAAYFNLPLLDLQSSGELKLQQNLYYFNNTFYSDADFLNAVTGYLPVLERDADSLSNRITYNKHSPTDKKFDNTSLDEYFDSIGLQGWLRSLLLAAYLGEYGLNTEVCCAINFLFLFGTAPEGNLAIYGQSNERYKISGGNQRITNALANELKNNLRPEHKLVKLKNSGPGYQLYFDNIQKPVYADIVLLALPFTLLREIEMDADIPGTKRNAIKNLSYGNTSKLVMGFKSRIWRTKYGSTGMCYTDNGVQNCWDNSQMQPGAHGGLTVYLGGDAAVALSNDNVASQGAHYLPKLNQIFPGIDATYNNKVQRMVWPKYQLTKASYSAWTVGQYTTIAGSEIETVDNLFFAGEHTSYNFQGFMNGGAATGRVAANNILQKIGR